MKNMQMDMDYVTHPWSALLKITLDHVRVHIYLRGDALNLQIDEEEGWLLQNGDEL